VAKGVQRAAGEWARQKAAEARRIYYEAKVTVTRKARQAAAYVAKHNPIPDIVAAAKPLIAVAKAVVTADPNLPAIIVGAARDVVADVAKATDAIRDAVVEQVGAVVETVSEAVDWGAVWDGVKSVGNVVAEVTGFNDIKNCVTKGDMEACAWAVATVAGAALGGVGAGLVRAAKAGRMASQAAKYADDIAKAPDRVGDTVDRVESAVECTSLAADLLGNSLVPGTEVVMADGTRKPMEKVEAGDEVMATDPTTGKTSGQEVTATIKGKGQKKLVRLTVDTDGDAGSATDTITATDGHPFWVPSLNKWLKAGELKPGQWLQTGSGSWVQLDSVRAWTQHATVHNLSVDRSHTFVVASGAATALVHNCGSRKVGPVDHVALGRQPRDSEFTVKRFAKDMGARHFMDSNDWEGDVVRAVDRLSRGEARISFMLDGLPGGNRGPAAALKKAKEAAGSKGGPMATQWELLEVDKAGMMDKVDFYRWNRRLEGWGKAG
jgi:hypothetical protein